MALTRRAFIQAGAVGTAALVAAGAYEGWQLRDHVAPDGTALTPALRALFVAVLPVLIEGAGGASSWTPPLEAAALAGVERTVAGLPPASQKELRQLGSLLDQRPIRFALTGVWSSWDRTDNVAVKAFLLKWRYSSNPMLASGYQALHDIALGAWYARPETWPDLGYAGPPSLTGGPVA
jgi:hypothetical protein